MGGQGLHIMMIFVMLGVFFNILRRPDSFTKLLAGTFTSLTGLTSGIAGIGG